MLSYPNKNSYVNTPRRILRMSLLRYTFNITKRFYENIDILQVNSVLKPRTLVNTSLEYFMYCFKLYNHTFKFQHHNKNGKIHFYIICLFDVNVSI